MNRYVSPYIQQSRRRAEERARNGQRGRRRASKSPDKREAWNADNKPKALFDPSLKKKEIFRHEPKRRPPPREKLEPSPPPSPDSVSSSSIFDECFDPRGLPSPQVKYVPLTVPHSSMTNDKNPSPAPDTGNDDEPAPATHQEQQGISVSSRAVPQTGQVDSSSVGTGMEEGTGNTTGHEVHVSPRDRDSPHDHPHQRHHNDSAHHKQRSSGGRHHRTRSTSPLPESVLQSLLGEDFSSDGQGRRRMTTIPELSSSSIPHDEYRDIFSSIADMMKAVKTIVSDAKGGGLGADPAVNNIPPYHPSSPLQRSPRQQLPSRRNLAAAAMSPRVEGTPKMSLRPGAVPGMAMQGAALPLRMADPSPGTSEPTQILRHVGMPGAGDSPATLAQKIEGHIIAMQQKEQETLRLLRKPRRASYSASSSSVPTTTMAARIPTAGRHPARDHLAHTMSRVDGISMGSSTNNTVEYEVDRLTGEVKTAVGSSAGNTDDVESDGRASAHDFLHRGPSLVLAAPATVPATSLGGVDADFLATLRPGGALKEGEQPQLHRPEYLAPLASCDGLSATVHTYLKKYKAAKKVKDATFLRNGITMAQAVHQMSEALIDDVLGDVAKEMEGFFSEYAELVIKTL